MISVKPKTLRITFLFSVLILVNLYAFFPHNPHKKGKLYNDDSGVNFNDFDLITLNTGDKFNGTITGHTNSGLNLKPLVIGNLNKVYQFEYSDIRDIKLTAQNKDPILGSTLSASQIEIENFRKELKAYYLESRYHLSHTTISLKRI